MNITLTDLQVMGLVTPRPKELCSELNSSQLFFPLQKEGRDALNPIPGLLDGDTRYYVSSVDFDLHALAVNDDSLIFEKVSYLRTLVKRYNVPVLNNFHRKSSEEIVSDNNDRLVTGSTDDRGTVSDSQGESSDNLALPDCLQITSADSEGDCIFNEEASLQFKDVLENLFLGNEFPLGFPPSGPRKALEKSILQKVEALSPLTVVEILSNPHGLSPNDAYDLVGHLRSIWESIELGSGKPNFADPLLDFVVHRSGKSDFTMKLLVTVALKTYLTTPNFDISCFHEDMDWVLEKMFGLGTTLTLNVSLAFAEQMHSVLTRAGVPDKDHQVLVKNVHWDITIPV